MTRMMMVRSTTTGGQRCGPRPFEFHDTPNSNKEEDDPNRTTTTSSLTANESNNDNEQPTLDAPWRHGHCMDIVFGGSLAVAALGATLGLELTAAVLYLLAALFYEIAVKSREQATRFFWPLCILGVVFFMVSAVLLFADAIVLILSVLMTEILAAVAGLLTTLFGGCHCGQAWYQYIRKLCHLGRWAFRGFHQEWQPQRGRWWDASIGDTSNDPTCTTGQANGANAHESTATMDKAAENDTIMTEPDIVVADPVVVDEDFVKL